MPEILPPDIVNNPAAASGTAGSTGTELPPPASAYDFWNDLKDLLDIGKDAASSSGLFDMTQAQWDSLVGVFQRQMSKNKWRVPREVQDQLDMARVIRDMGGSADDVLAIVGGVLQQGYRNPQFSLMQSLWNPYDMKRWGYGYNQGSAE